MKFFIHAMVFISGFTGLIYQITWQKYLSIYLGSHALSTTLTLSCFFLFLAAGYHLAGRWGHRLGKSPIKTYGIIEGLIGAYAILSPSLFFKMYEVWPSYPSNDFTHFAMSFLFALVLMGFPTLLMGSTIPLLTQGLSQKLQEGHRVHAWVYGVNTMGAFFGSLLAGFYLLESFGLEQTLNMTGALNCLVFLLITLGLRLSQRAFEGYRPLKTSKEPPASTPQYLLLAVAFFSGFLSFGVESLTIRMAGIAVGSSNYTYCIIVSAFIISIALGSFMAGMVKDKNGLKVLLLSQLGLLATLIGLYFSIPYWPDGMARLWLVFSRTAINFNIYWASVFIGFLLALIAPVSLLGLTLPLVFQQMKRRGQFLNQTAGKMYAVNSAGAAIGAILGGYILFAFFSASSVFTGLLLVALLNFALILAHSQALKPFAAGGLLLVAIGLFFLPPWSDSHFVPTRFGLYEDPQNHKELRLMFDELNNRVPRSQLKILFSDFGVNTYTVVAEAPDKSRALYVNGKPDADTKGDRHTRSMTALFPLALSKKNKNVFIVGLGTGMSAGIAASLPTTQSVRVAEISKGVVDSMPFFSKWNFNIEKNIHKITIENDDAYKALKTTPQKYDLIFSEPSNTWVTGVEKIYTQEFLKMAASKLSKGGIYSQWFPLFMMTEPGFLSILKNFRGAFSNVTLWNAGGGTATVILASNTPFDFDKQHFVHKDELLGKILKTVDFESSKDILMHQMLSNSDTEILALASTIPHSLFHPRLAYESGRAHFLMKIVNLDTLTSKYFLPMKEDAPVATDLVWQDQLRILDEGFFEKAEKYFQTHAKINFPLGRLFLARTRLFPPAKPSQKVQQYSFLQSTTPAPSHKAIPRTDKTFKELYGRHLNLKSLRQKSNLANVIRIAPEKCKNDGCLQTKLEILERLGSPKTASIRKMNKGPQKEQAKMELEKLFRHHTKTL